MFDFFNTYSLSDIIIFLVLLAGAMMGMGKFFEWLFGSLKKVFDKDYLDKERQQVCQTRFTNLEGGYEKLQDSINHIIKQNDDMAMEITALTESDKDAIKAYIVERHHHFRYFTGWIDEHSLDTIERRWSRYKLNGGNSYVDGLMNELRHLPRKDEE